MDIIRIGYTVELIKKIRDGVDRRTIEIFAELAMVELSDICEKDLGKVYCKIHGDESCDEFCYGKRELCVFGDKCKFMNASGECRYFHKQEEYSVKRQRR